jgi:hypothetical protein
VQNKGAIIDFTRFENNYVSTNATTNQLNADIEPDWYQSFVYETGVKVNVKKSKPWLNATMQNGWTGTVQYFKNDLGQVTLKISGLTKGTTTALTVIANLPTGYQPVAHFPIVLEDSPNGGVGKMLYLATNGNLIIPSGQDFSQPFTYSGLVTFYAG